MNHRSPTHGCALGRGCVGLCAGVQDSSARPFGATSHRLAQIGPRPAHGSIATALRLRARARTSSSTVVTVCLSPAAADRWTFEFRPCSASSGQSHPVARNDEATSRLPPKTLETCVTDPMHSLVARTVFPHPDRRRECECALRSVCAVGAGTRRPEGSNQSAHRRAPCERATTRHDANEGRHRRTPAVQPRGRVLDSTGAPRRRTRCCHERCHADRRRGRRRERQQRTRGLRDRLRPRDVHERAPRPLGPWNADRTADAGRALDEHGPARCRWLGDTDSLARRRRQAHDGVERRRHHDHGGLRRR